MNSRIALLYNEVYESGIPCESYIISKNGSFISPQNKREQPFRIIPLYLNSRLLTSISGLFTCCV